MSILFFSGLETGDASEWTSSSGTLTFDQTIVRGGGGYSLKIPWNNTNHYVNTNFSSTQSSGYARFGIYTTAAGGASVSWVAGFYQAGVVIGAIRLVTDGSGLIYLRLYDNVSSAQVGSDYQIQPNNWYTVYLKLVVSASTGVLEMQVNGVTVATGSSLNTGSTNISSFQMGQQIISGSGATGNVWFDDVMLRNDAYPANGYCIARQGTNIAPNYNSWTLTGGANIWNVWDSTPFSATANASTTGFGNEQTMVVDFTTVGGTGSTGHGTGNVGSFDIINAVKIAGVGKTSSTSADGTDSTVFRTPAGGGGADTVTGLPAAWTTSDSYQEIILASTPTLAQVRSCEVGFSKGTGSNTHTIEDAWAMVDFLPVPYTMFEGSETEPYTPLSFETLVEDGGEEVSWYPPTAIDDAALLIAQQLQILIVDMPSRSFAEASEGDYFPPIDPDLAALSFILPPPTIIATIASQWDNATVPLDNEQLIEDSEGDFYPDFGIDLAWYISFFQPLTVQLVCNDLTLEPDIADFSLVQASTFIPVGPASAFLVYSDYVPVDTDELIDDPADGDFYPDFSIDIAWYFVPVTQIDPSLVFNEYIPWELETLTEDDGSEYEWYPVEDSPLAWIILQVETTIASSQWDNQAVDYLELYSEESEGDYYPDFDVDPSSFFAQIPPGIGILISASQWDNKTVDFVDLYVEESEGDYYPDTSIDNTWYFNQFIPPASITQVFSDYSPDDFDGQMEPSEADYYPAQDELLSWFIPSTYFSTTLFGSWVYNILNGQLPTTQPTGSLTLYGGGSGSATWVGLAFSGTEGLQIQTTAGGTLGTDSAIPTDFLVITGNEMFTVYYTMTDVVPSQIEFQFYDATTASWKIAYLGTDNFGLGGLNKGGVPNILGMWLSFTVTAADLGLAKNDVITGVGWGVYNATGTSTVVFSDTLAIQTVLQDNLVASQWDNQSVDYLDLYTDDLGEGDYYPEFDVDAAPILNVSASPLLVFVDFPPDVYEDDTSDEPAWYAPIDELLSWFIPPLTNENFVFTDYSPWEAEQLTEDDGSDAWYVPFGNEVENWLFVPSPVVLVFNDYSPTDTDELADDDGSEVAWYPAFGNEVENWFFAQPVLTYLVFADYSPTDTDQLTEDDGSDQSWYPPFGNESQNWSQIITTIMVVFVDYAPSDPDQLIEDDGSDGSWYPAFGNEAENWAHLITTIMVVFIDYAPTDSEQLIEDDGSDAWYVPFGNEVEDWIQLLPAPTQILISSSQWDNQAADALENYIDDLSDPDIYPDTSIDNTWYFVQVIQLITSLIVAVNQTDDAGNAVPLAYDSYIEDDGSEPVWYPIEGNIIVSLAQDVSFIVASSDVYNHAIDTFEMQSDDLGDELAWYPPQDELLSWFIPPFVVSYLVFIDYNPTDSDQLIEDIGDQAAWYPPVEDILSPALFAEQLADAFRLMDYAPMDTDQLIEDTGDEQAWYPTKEEELQWFIPGQLNAFAVFNDYAPLDTEQLTEEQEGDFYPDFGVDPSPWQFLLGSGVAILIASGSAPETPDDQILDLGDEPAWYLVTGDILSFFIPVGVEVLVGSSQEYGKAIDFLELYSEESEGDYYPPQDDTFSWFFRQVLIITDFIFIEYNPLELDQLIEEQEGDFYPSFDVDPSPWFFTVQPAPTLYSAAIQWYAVPQEMEFMTEDLGEDISWFYPLDIVVVLIGSIQIQVFMPLTNIVQLYFNLQTTSTATQIVYGN